MTHVKHVRWRFVAGVVSHFVVAELPSLSISDVQMGTSWSGSQQGSLSLFPMLGNPIWLSPPIGNTEEDGYDGMCSSGHGLQSFPAGTSPFSGQGTRPKAVKGITQGHSAGTV